MIWPTDGMKVDVSSPPIVLRGALAPLEQQRLFGDLCAAASGSYELQRLASDERHTAFQRPWPLCVHNHPFTQETNSRRPEPVFVWAHALARKTADSATDAAVAAALERAVFDSLVSVLYPVGGALKPHVDEGLVGYGLAVSLGASCVFEIGGDEHVLESGDAVFAPFGQVPHAVLTTHALSTAPGWWRPVSFGRARCSVQLRRGLHS